MYSKSFSKYVLFLVKLSPVLVSAVANTLFCSLIKVEPPISFTLQTTTLYIKLKFSRIVFQSLKVPHLYPAK